MDPAYRPMLATLVDEPFDDKAWIFETKWDGFRLITEKSGDAVKPWSRNGISVTTKYARCSYQHFKRSRDLAS
jgi:bifunctional non-homologous end joining protein LigD